MPDALYWLAVVEKWGFVWPGGYLDQPCHFMRALEAADLGREQARQAHEERAHTAQLMAASLQAMTGVMNTEVG